MCASPCSRAILALQVVGDKPLTSWLVVSLGTKYTQAPTPPQTPAPFPPEFECVRWKAPP